MKANAMIQCSLWVLGAVGTGVGYVLSPAIELTTPYEGTLIPGCSGTPPNPPTLPGNGPTNCTQTDTTITCVLNPPHHTFWAPYCCLNTEDAGCRQVEWMTACFKTQGWKIIYRVINHDQTWTCNYNTSECE